MAVAIGSVTLSACGAGDEDAGLSVAASTGIVAEITSQVAGEDAEVVQIVPDSASPHEFQPSADDRRRLEQADLVVLNGAGLDATVPVGDAEPAWVLTEHTPDPIEFGSEDEEGAGGVEEHDEGAQDPHVWMDPTRVAAALPSLANALGDADPEHADDYRSRADDLARRLVRLDRELAAELRAIPGGARELVTSHDALAYFADRYELEVIATAFPATGAGAEPSARGLAEVIAVVEAAGTRALFAEETDDPKVLRSVAAATGATVVDDLLVESPGSAGTYAAMLRHDAGRIAAALGG